MLPSSAAGWAGSLGELIAVDPASFVETLRHFVPDAGTDQVEAWTESLNVLREQGAAAFQVHPPVRDDGTIWEYDLPYEGGRRPDVLVLQNGTVAVIEFKKRGPLRRSDLDQVAAYARDLSEYHSACRDVNVIPFLVICDGKVPASDVDGVQVVPPKLLGDRLVDLSRAGKDRPRIALASILDGEYSPLPTLVAAARIIFEKKPLPFVRRAKSAGVGGAVNSVLEIAARAKAESRRSLVLLTGVPGAGKTLVGLQVAHAVLPNSASGSASRGIFLSGNGPLVQVLQDALDSTLFVKDVHAFIRSFGFIRPAQRPGENIFVFDEAQRAWDPAKMADFYTGKPGMAGKNVRRSEPELFVDTAARASDWTVVLALIGEGQEIHTGEEAGLRQWASAIAARNPSEGWTVHGPAHVKSIFDPLGLSITIDPLLALDTSLRSHVAADLHEWVRLILDDSKPPAIARAAALAGRLRREAFPIYVTRDLLSAREYVRRRFGGESLRRYGLLASSKAKILLDYGIDPTYQATKRLKVGPWFNADPTDAQSCCQLTQPATEFQAQGLELDLPIVCWGDDFLWDATGWEMRKTQPNPLVHDPERLRRNAYRVLLTRGREGMMIFVPPDQRLEATAQVLLSAGAVGSSALAVAA